MFDIQQQLKKIPEKPGVYIMKDENNTKIYIGKAINLKNRVRSYFVSNHNSSLKLENLVKNIKEFEYIITDNELEALILECNLIKEYRPKYNVLLKDDKAYPYIKISTNQMYPRVFMVHRHENDKCKYFGPYTSRYVIKETLDLIHKVWPLRRCHKIFPRDFCKERPCLNYFIQKCKAPCNRNIDVEDYNFMISEIIDFLTGKDIKILQKLQSQMYIFSENMEFEKAAEIRDKISAIKILQEKQKLETDDMLDQDIIAFARAYDEAVFQIFFIRAGKMTGRDQIFLEISDEDSKEYIMSCFIKQFYTEVTYIPNEIVLQTDILDKEIIMKWLTTLKKSVNIIIPKKGDKFKLVQLAHKNAVDALEQFGEKMKKEYKKTIGALEEISSALNISSKLTRIEAYDISNTFGNESVGSMIVFENGKQKRSDYRKFKIKSVYGPNDYASIEEIIYRRFSRYKKECQILSENTDYVAKFSTLPDIIFIDGGRGHVSSAKKALDALDVDIYICGIVKDDKHKTRGIIYENQEIYLNQHSEGFKLITRIQDEVHRFAIEYHRKLREDIMVKSELDDIKNIGKVRRIALIKHFGSIDKIKRASIDQLQSIDGMNKLSAEHIYNYFREKNNKINKI